MLRREIYRNPKIFSESHQRDSRFVFSPIIIRIIVLLIFISFVIWVLFFSSLFKIKTIEINGSLNPEVKAEIDKFYGKNILSFSTGKIEKNLGKKQTSIETLEIKRGLPNTLKVKVNVRNTAIGWKTQNKNYLIDENGIIFELENYNPSVQGVPVVEDVKNIIVNPGNQIVTPEFVEFVKNLIKRSKDEQKIQITAIRVMETTFQIECDTDQGFRIILSTIESLDNQLKALAKVIETKRVDIHEYVDLRIIGRVYYK